jgi:hypothetical protein
MSETKHSPLPWKQDGVSVLDAKGHEVAETWGNQFAKMVLPDAAFIVTAVNAHDKLQADRKALLEALHAFVDQTLVLPSGESVWGEELTNARAAIAQAEKED